MVVTVRVVTFDVVVDVIDACVGVVVVVVAAAFVGTLVSFIGGLGLPTAGDDNPAPTYTSSVIFVKVHNAAKRVGPIALRRRLLHSQALKVHSVLGFAILLNSGFLAASLTLLRVCKFANIIATELWSKDLTRTQLKYPIMPKPI